MASQTSFLKNERVAVHLTLANGKAVTVDSGHTLPAGMPDNFGFYYVPHLSVPGMTDPDVYIRSTLGAWRQNMANIKSMDMARRIGIMLSAERCVREIVPRLNHVYWRKAQGDEQARQEWQDFCDDCTIVIDHRAVLSGQAVVVLLDIPTATASRDARHATSSMLRLTIDS